MKTIEIQLYKFEELSTEAQQKAISKNYDFNVNYEWWDSTYDDAKNVGIEITGFDIDRGSYCKGDIMDTEQTAHDIMKQHGEHCDTYQTAAEYLKTRDTLITDWLQDENGDYVNEDELDSKLDELGNDFEYAILEEYRVILTKEYDYLTSDQTISDSLIANDYNFTIEGDMY